LKAGETLAGRDFSAGTVARGQGVVMVNDIQAIRDLLYPVMTETAQILSGLATR
jgi:hypothetical protein